MLPTEELSLVLRYVFNNEVKEVFVDFIEVERITGVMLEECILDWLSKNKLSLLDMHCQRHDGASNMSGAHSGCKAIVQQSALLEMYRLSLCITLT